MQFQQDDATFTTAREIMNFLTETPRFHILKFIVQYTVTVGK